MSIEFNVDQALAKLGELVSKHGPDAVNLAAQVVQVDALNRLTNLPFFAALSAATFMLARWFLKRADAIEDEYDRTGWHIGMAFSGGASVLTFIPAVWTLFDVWMWVALFNPKLALAHEVFERLTKVAS